MRTPTLNDLHQQDADDPAISAPVYPEPWAQPALSSLLQIAADWPIDVLSLPYAGCAMLSWTRSTSRNALVRLAPASDRIRADFTQCRPTTYPAAGVDLFGTYAQATGATDGTAVRVYCAPAGIGLFSWPFNSQVAQQARGTLSGACPSSPATNEDRQIDVTAQKSAQVEIVATERHCAVTFWAGLQHADLSTL